MWLPHRLLDRWIVMFARRVLNHRIPSVYVFILETFHYSSFILLKLSIQHFGLSTLETP